MDEIAREFAVRGPDDPNRGPLLEELSALTELRKSILPMIFQYCRDAIESEANRRLAQPIEELARALAALKASNRLPIQIIAEIISKSHSLNEH
jgi:hypothetical protein